MRAVLWLLLLASVAVGVAVAARYNEGYVLFVLPPWRVELSMNLLVLLALAAFLLGHLLLRAVNYTLALPRSVAAFRTRQARERALNELQHAGRLLTEGRYGHAMRTAERAWPNHPQAGLVALVGWRAAHALRDAAQVAVWRERAAQGGRDNEAARRMTEAELALRERRFEDARAALNQLGGGGARHIAALRLLMRAEQGLGNWREVARLVRQLEKVRALTPEQAAPLRQRALRETLRGLAGDLSGLQRYWQTLDEAERSAPALALEASSALGAAGDCREAQRIIEDALEDRWDAALVLAYADCRGGDVLGRIARAEKWLNAHPRDEALLLTLGRLCRAQQLWGKARSFLEASLAIRPTRAAHLELATLLEGLGESTAAARHYRDAALLNT